MCVRSNGIDRGVCRVVRGVDSRLFVVMPRAWATLLRMRVLVNDWSSPYSPPSCVCVGVTSGLC